MIDSDPLARLEPGEVVVRPTTLDDAEEYVRCHVQCLAETYDTIMPPAFVEQQRAAIPDRIVETRRAWAARMGDAQTRTRSWIAVDHGGSAVGVARSGPGPQPWELSMGAPDSAVDFELHHLYTRRHSHGSGLGQQLLELATQGQAAYLWILRGNPRAERFYRRNGFEPDGAELSCGPTWFHRPMFRMVRTTASSSAVAES